MRYYKSLSEIARRHGIHRSTATRWRDSGAITEGLEGWPVGQVDAVADEHHRRHEAQSKTRSLRDEKHRLECERLEVQIKHAREILAQEKLRTKRLEDALVPRELHERITVEYRKMFTAGIDQVATEAIGECPHAAQAINAAVAGLRARL